MFAVSKQVTPLTEEFNENLSSASHSTKRNYQYLVMAFMQFPFTCNGNTMEEEFQFQRLVHFATTEFEFRYLGADVRAIRNRQGETRPDPPINQRIPVFACMCAKRGKEKKK